MNYTAQQIAQAAQTSIEGDNNLIVSTISTDSRTIGAANGVMFVAIAGPLHDGHRFVYDLYQQGVRCFLVGQNYAPPHPMPNATLLRAESPLLALQQLAAYHRSQFHYPIVGITGSNGKTMVKEWLGQLMAHSHKVVRSPKSYNSQLGVPLAVLELDPDYNLGIFEAGISQPNEMERLSRIIRPDVGIITNIGQPHQENFESLEQKADEKLRLFESCHTLIYNADCNIIAQAVMRTPQVAQTRHLAWSSVAGKAAVTLLGSHTENGQTRITAKWRGNSIEFDIPFADQASVENAMHCLCAMLHFGINPNEIAQQMLQLSPVAMRLELKNGINGCAIINDSYNSDIGSLRIALNFMTQQRLSHRVLILSDIEQSGLSPEVLYSEVAQLTRQKGVDKIIGVGPTISAHAHLFGMGKEFYPTTDALIKQLNRNQLSHTAVLIKGSRSFAFERIAALLEQKAHRTTLEVNMNALAHNLNHYRSLLAPGVRTMVMVKAFAYGAGSVEVATLLQYQRIDYLGVAFADEGVELRQAGIDTPIMVMNPSFGTYDHIIEHKLEPEIYNITGLHEFVLALKRTNQRDPYPIHIKLDSGMHRLGFMPNDLPQLLKMLDTQADMVRVASVFSHLAVSDEPERDNFTQQQIAQFDECSEHIAKHLGYNPIRHILNSSGIERFANAQFDMVRLGIGLHGISPNTQTQNKLQTVSTLKTRIIQVKHLQPGDYVGYGLHGQITRPSTIAIIPIGYADGLSRRLGNGAGQMLVNGHLCPTIGNICMDTCMLDTTEIVAAEGDEVVIFGSPALPVWEVAQNIGTIPYELLTGISRRVNRVYYQE